MAPRWRADLAVCFYGLSPVMNAVRRRLWLAEMRWLSSGTVSAVTRIKRPIHTGSYVCSEILHEVNWQKSAIS